MSCITINPIAQIFYVALLMLEYVEDREFCIDDSDLNRLYKVDAPRLHSVSFVGGLYLGWSVLLYGFP